MPTWVHIPAASIAAWLLIHSLWQAAIVWFVSGMARRNTGPHTRSAISLASLLALLLFQVCTLFVLTRSQKPILPDRASTSAAALSASNQVIEERLTARRLVKPATWTARSWWRDSTASLTWYGQLFVGLWLIATIVLLLRQAASIALLSHLIRRQPLLSPDQAAVLSDCGKRVGVRRPIAFRSSDLISSPATCGWIDPVVLLPSGLHARLAPNALRAIVLHEAAHIRRGDYLVNLLLGFCAAVYAFNPFVHLLKKQALADRELSCDQIAAAAAADLGIGADDYAQMLVDFAATKTRPLLLGFGGNDGNGSLAQRVSQLLNDYDALNRPASWSWLSGSVVAVLLALGLVGRPMVAMAKVDRELTQLESETFAESVLRLYDLNRPNQRAVDAVAMAISIVRDAGGDVQAASQDARFVDVIKVLANGADPHTFDQIIHESTKLRRTPRSSTPWAFGDNSERYKASGALLIKIQSTNDFSIQLETAKAAIVLATLTDYGLDGVQAYRLQIEPDWLRAMQLSPEQLQRGWMINAVRDDRLRAFKDAEVALKSATSSRECLDALRDMCAIARYSLTLQKQLAQLLSDTERFRQCWNELEANPDKGAGELTLARRLLQATMLTDSD